MQRADGRGAGHILHQRRIHIQGFGDRPQLQLLQAGQAFRRCRAGCRRKFQADNRRAPPRAGACTARAGQPGIGRSVQPVRRFALPGERRTRLEPEKKEEEKEETD